MIMVAGALASARERLAHQAAPHLEAEILLAHVLGTTRTWLHTWPDKSITSHLHEAFLALVERREQGEPIAYLTGRQGFHAIELSVSPAVLIPRPETELLVDIVLALPNADNQEILDLGTGSGCIALAIAAACPTATITATDTSEAALEVARDNAAQLGLANVRFLQGDWFEPVAGESFDVIVSNPPYVVDGDPHLTAGDLRYEPQSALISGPKGLDALERIIAPARAHLRPGGLLAVEHGMTQAEAVAALFQQTGFEDVQTDTDLAGLPRVTRGQYGRI